MNDGTTGYGGVAYDYRIGTTEVTNAQYAAFLNEKAKSDPLGLYNANMGSNARGGITQSGVSRQLHLRGQDQHGRQAGELCELVRFDPLCQLAATTGRGAATRKPARTRSWAARRRPAMA